MPKNPKRHYGRLDLHFLTFSCYQRLPLLDSMPPRNLFVQVLDEIRERYEFKLLGYVVMPNHVHLLISESVKATPSVVLKVLKQRVSHDLRKIKIPHVKPAYGEAAEKSAFPDSGKHDFTISTSGATRSYRKSLSTCLRTRSHGSWLNIPRIGRGAVGRSTTQERTG
jgi:REP element-mobilizing transposase RayT